VLSLLRILCYGLNQDSVFGGQQKGATHRLSSFAKASMPSLGAEQQLQQVWLS
jgi:hypothetical protein